MPDIYFSYPKMIGNKAAQNAYRALEERLGGDKAEQIEALKLIYQHHPAETLPGGSHHDAFSWSNDYLGSKWLNMWLDDSLVVESAWDAPFAFYLHLYAYLWKFDPYVHLWISFMGNDEGEAHWIYGEQFSKRISEEEILKAVPPNHPNPQSFYLSERDKIMAHFHQGMSWREWAADEIGDLLMEKCQQSIERFQLGELSFHYKNVKAQIHWKAEHTLDPNAAVTMIYDVDDDGYVEDQHYDGPGGEYLENHPSIWRLFREMKFSVPKPKLPKPPTLSTSSIPKVLRDPQNDFPNTAEESALLFLRILVQEEYLELTDSDALPDIAAQVSWLFEANLSNYDDAYQTAEALTTKLLEQDSVEEIYLSDEELARRLRRW